MLSSASVGGVAMGVHRVTYLSASVAGVVLAVQTQFQFMGSRLSCLCPSEAGGAWAASGVGVALSAVGVRVSFAGLEGLSVRVELTIIEQVSEHGVSLLDRYDVDVLIFSGDGGRLGLPGEKFPLRSGLISSRLGVKLRVPRGILDRRNCFGSRSSLNCFRCRCKRCSPAPIPV